MSSGSNSKGTAEPPDTLLRAEVQRPENEKCSADSPPLTLKEQNCWMLHKCFAFLEKISIIVVYKSIINSDMILVNDKYIFPSVHLMTTIAHNDQSQ